MSDWTLVAHPVQSHARLEALARGLWELIAHGVPWPTGWVVRWGVLARGVMGLCDYRASTVVISEQRHRDLGSTHELEETIVHELVHVMHPESSHGLAHRFMLKRAMDYLMSLAPTPARKDEPMELEYASMTINGQRVERTAAFESLKRAREARRNANYDRLNAAGVEIIAELKRGRLALPSTSKATHASSLPRRRTTDYSRGAIFDIC